LLQGPPEVRKLSLRLLQSHREWPIRAEQDPLRAEGLGCDGERRRIVRDAVHVDALERFARRSAAHGDSRAPRIEAPLHAPQGL